MTYEDKLKQIARNIACNLGNKVCDDIKTYGYEDVYTAVLQALQWKDEQEIEFLQSLMFQAPTQQALNIIINNRIKLLKGE